MESACAQKSGTICPSLADLEAGQNQRGDLTPQPCYLWAQGDVCVMHTKGEWCLLVQQSYEDSILGLLILMETFSLDKEAAKWPFHFLCRTKAKN